MTRKITGWILCAVAALQFAGGFGPIAVAAHRPVATLVDGSSPTPPPYIPPARAAAAVAVLMDGSSPTPPPYIPPARAAVAVIAPLDGSSPTPPPYIPPAHSA